MMTRYNLSLNTKAQNGEQINSWKKESDPEMILVSCIKAIPNPFFTHLSVCRNETIPESKWRLGRTQIIPAMMDR